MGSEILDSLYASLFAGIIGGFFFFAALKARFFTLSPLPKAPVTTSDIFFGFFFRFFSFQLMTFLIHYIGIQKLQNSFIGKELLGFWVNFFPLMLTLLFYLLYFGGFHAETLRLILRQSKTTFLQDFKIALFSLVMAYPISLFINGFSKTFLLLFFPENFVPDQNVVQEMKNVLDLGSFKAIFLMLLNTVILAPILEEFLFRGLLQNWLQKWLQRGVSILVTSLIFAFFHFHISQNLGNLPILLSTFTLSCFLGTAYEKQKSLLCPVLLHAFFNLFSSLLLFLFYFN